MATATTPTPNSGSVEEGPDRMTSVSKKKSIRDKITFAMQQRDDTLDPIETTQLSKTISDLQHELLTNHTANSTAVLQHNNVYELIIGQLKADGYEDAAQILSDKVLHGKKCMPTTRLAHIAELGAQSDNRQRSFSEMQAATAGTPINTSQKIGLDFDNAIPSQFTSAHFIPKLKYLSNHRGPVRCITFSNDGQFAASADSASLVKVFDVNKAVGTNDTSGDDTSAIVRVIVDHTKPINDMAFHPKNEFLVSCAKDNSVRFFNFHQVGNRPFKTIDESHNVRTIGMHPSGMFLAVGTDHPILRIYDIETSQCYATQNVLDHHRAPLTQIRYNSNGRQFASACKGGAVKIWDGRSCRCTMTWDSAHGGCAVSTVQFSKNDKYLLTGGRDNTVKLWDLRTGKVLNQYLGSQQERRRQSCFGHDESRVYAINEQTRGIVSWDAKTGTGFPELESMGAGRWIAHSPIASVLAVGGDDKKVKFWLLDSTPASDNTDNSVAGGGEAEDTPAPTTSSSTPTTTTPPPTTTPTPTTTTTPTATPTTTTTPTPTPTPTTTTTTTPTTPTSVQDPIDEIEACKRFLAATSRKPIATKTQDQTVEIKKEGGKNQAEVEKKPDEIKKEGGSENPAKVENKTNEIKKEGGGETQAKVENKMDEIKKEGSGETTEEPSNKRRKLEVNPDDFEPTTPPGTPPS